MKAYVIAVLVLALAPGCKKSRFNYTPPAIPSNFIEQHNTSCKTTDLYNWWNTFNDPYLSALIKQAIAHNYTLALALEKIEESRALYATQRAELFPHVEGIGSVTRERVSNALLLSSAVPVSRLSFFQVGFDGSWEIDFWGKIWREKRARAHELAANIHAMQDTHLILTADLAQAYITLCELNNTIPLVHKQCVFAQRLIALEKELLVAGLSNDILVAQREQYYTTFANTYQELLAQRAQKKHQIAVLVGVAPQELQLATASSIPQGPDIIHTGLPSDLIRRRPDIRRAEQELAASHERVGQAAAEWFPSFRLLGGITTESNTKTCWLTKNSLAWYIGPSVRWPLINFGRIRATVQAKESVRRQAALTYSNAIINALRDVEDSLSGYFYYTEELHITEQALTQAQKEQERTCDQTHAGLANEQACIQAAINALSKSIAYAQSQARVSIQLVTLYKALGGGW